MEALLLILFWGYITIQIVRKAMKFGSEAIEKAKKHQESQGDVPDCIKKLFEYEKREERRPKKKLATTKKVSAEGLSYDMPERPLTAYVPLDIVEHEDDLELELLGDDHSGASDDDALGSDILYGLDMRHELRKGIIYKEILERKYGPAR